jgi:FkbH-like protein
MRRLIDGVNRELAEFVILGSGDVLLDVAGAGGDRGPRGLARSAASGTWRSSPSPANSFRCTPTTWPAWSRRSGARAESVLILDLDNTVWGGVIGDDGLDGIQIAQGDARGEAHLAVQQLGAGSAAARHRAGRLVEEHRRGGARRRSRSIPEMLLRLEHIAVFQANWNDKATNIQAIAEELSLGLDAMVFLDDNPVERGLVRKLLPQVAVPELPEEPAYYARTLAAGGYFEAVALASRGPEARGLLPGQREARRQLQKQVGGVDAYLTSLEMTITFQPFDATGRARIVQLINKSNQYNLTTRRYTDPEAADRGRERPFDVFTLQVRLTDTFGDNGMISVVICRPGAPGVWEIDTWLMSCRVLGRMVEHMVLREILEHARAAGIRTLAGVYKPTDRNKLVIDHYSKLGFTKVAEEESGLTRWELAVDPADPARAPMKVVSEGFAAVVESAHP